MNRSISRRVFPSLISDMSDLQQEINRLFQPSRWTERGSSNVMATDWIPQIDVKEEDNQYVIQADIPGVDPTDIEVGMEDGVLTIKGKKESQHEEKTEGYFCLERSKGSFYRSLSLPQQVDESKITAKNKNGVLTIIVPKLQKSATKKIPVEAT